MINIAQIPLNLQINATSLKPLGVNEYAWVKEYALDVVQFCQNNQIAILGGDVLEKDADDKISYTYDNWYIEKKLNNWTDYVRFSCEYAIEKILFFSERFPDKQLLFVLIMSKG